MILIGHFLIFKVGAPCLMEEHLWDTYGTMFMSVYKYNLTNNFLAPGVPDVSCFFCLILCRGKQEKL